MSKPKVKRTPKPKPIGRPKVTDRDTGSRFQVYLLPDAVAAMRVLGAGSLSAGITKAAELLERSAARKQAN